METLYDHGMMMMSSLDHHSFARAAAEVLCVANVTKTVCGSIDIYYIIYGGSDKRHHFRCVARDVINWPIRCDLLICINPSDFTETDACEGST